ncbi:MAG: ParB N-terminal domain-containing protein [Verrucomicrobia bacterium]|nr:ParB N-terminal domain-containing protein [Verrucomicrobiota bacterium]
MSTTTVHEVPIDSIHQTPENWRIYIKPDADDQFAALVASVEELGILEPLTVSKDNFILSGHRRHAAAEAAGLDTVPIIRLDIEIGPMTPEERAKVLVAHNNGSRVKTATESIIEAMVAVDPGEAIRAAENRKANVFALAQTSHELVEVTEGSRRTNPCKQRGELLAAVQVILQDLANRDLLPTSARHIHYRLLSVGPLTSKGVKGHPYGTGKDDSEKLGKLLTDARSAGLIPDDWIADETRPESVIEHYDTIGDYVAGEVEGLFQHYFSNVHRDQPAHVEIIIEKNTLYPLLKSKVAHPLRIPISSARGYLSYPAGCRMVDRFRKSGKDRFVIIYVSDHDPEGMDMPSAFKKYLAFDHGVRVDVKRAAVTDEQIEKYELPPDAEAKPSSCRFKKYVARYGPKVWELDSMDMELLVREVERTCLSFLDVEALNAALEQEKQDDVKLARLNAAVARLIPDLLNTLEEMEHP